MESLTHMAATVPRLQQADLEQDQTLVTSSTRKPFALVKAALLVN
jgi:hypothetical protein